MYPAPEDAETLILGLASFPADIDLLNDHCQFEISKDHVEIDGGEVAATHSRVEFHEGLPADEPWQHGYRGQDCFQFFRIIGGWPVGLRHGQGGEGVTDGFLFPIHTRKSHRGYVFSE